MARATREQRTGHACDENCIAIYHKPWIYPPALARLHGWARLIFVSVQVRHSGDDQSAGVTGDSQRWQISFLGYWLANNQGADFLDLDYSVVDYSATLPDLNQIIAGTGRFEAIVSQVRALPVYDNLPI